MHGAPCSVSAPHCPGRARRTVRGAERTAYVDGRGGRARGISRGRTMAASRSTNGSPLPRACDSAEARLFCSELTHPHSKTRQGRRESTTRQPSTGIGWRSRWRLPLADLHSMRRPLSSGPSSPESARRPRENSTSGGSVCTGSPSKVASGRWGRRSGGSCGRTNALIRLSSVGGRGYSE